MAAQQADPFSILNYIRTLNTQRLDLPEVALGQTEVHQASDDTASSSGNIRDALSGSPSTFSPKASRDLRLGARLKALHVLDVGETVTTVTADSQGTLVRAGALWHRLFGARRLKTLPCRCHKGNLPKLFYMR